MDLQHVPISARLKCTTLGRTWLKLVDQILREGTPMGEEGLELLGVSVAFAASSNTDDLLDRFADRQMIAEMKKVFFGESSNTLGHSYARMIRGPDGRHDLQDIISLLRGEPLTKRALLTLCGQPGAKVPCINAVQFLIRDQAVQIMYFARGQDAFRKFYADALCLAAMAETVAAGLALRLGVVQGFIGSIHIYYQDMLAIQETLASANRYLETASG